MKEQEYLTDEELDALICEVEMTEMTMAPPDLLDDILQRIDATDDIEHEDWNESETKETVSEPAKPPRMNRIEKRRKEYRRFCIQVASSAAAAILLIFMLPLLTGGQDTAVPAKDKVLAEAGIKPREEALKRSDNQLMTRIGNSRYLSYLNSEEIVNDIFSEDGANNRIFDWRINQ